MSTELTTLDLTQLPSTQIGDDTTYAALVKGGDFLRFVKLYTKGKAIDTGKIPPGHFGIPENREESIVDLGDSINVVPLARRPKALDTNDLTAVVVSYDEQSPAFKAIQDRSAHPASGCQHGISFLVFEQSTGQFLELFFGNKSSRPEAKNLFPYLPLSQADIERRGLKDVEPHGPMPVTIKSRYASNKKGSWHVPVAMKCLTPVQLPPTTAVVAEITKFLSVKSGGVEKVQEPESRKSRAR